MLIHPSLVRREPSMMLAGIGIDETSWRVAWLVPAVVVGSLAASAVLTPAIYLLLDVVRESGAAGVAAFFHDKSPQRMFGGIRWIVLLIAVPLIMRACGFTSLRALGIELGRPALRMGWLWYGLGLVLIAGLAAAQIVLASGSFRPAPQSWWREIGHSLLVGYVGGLSEQIIFSGFVLRLFYAATRRPWLAVVLTAAFFAYTHIKVPGSVLAEIGSIATWDTGARMAVWTLLGVIRGFDPSHVTGLFLLGLTCGALTLRLGSVWPAAGLHAGLVTGMLILQRRWSPGGGPTRDIWGSSQMIDGWVPLLVLAALLLAVCLSPPRTPSSPSCAGSR